MAFEEEFCINLKRRFRRRLVHQPFEKWKHNWLLQLIWLHPQSLLPWLRLCLCKCRCNPFYMNLNLKPVMRMIYIVLFSWFWVLNCLFKFAIRSGDVTTAGLSGFYTSPFRIIFSGFCICNFVCTGSTTGCSRRNGTSTNAILFAGCGRN
jgi:hypothetical protein